MNSSLKTSHLGSALLIIAVIGALLSVAGTSLRSGNLACDNTAAALSLAVSDYVQDWDETFPPTRNTATFQAAVLPYAPSRSVFTCPVTGVDYKPNALLSNASLYSLGGDLSSIEVIRDGQPHADGLPTIGYADGHIERNGVSETDPELACKSDAKQIALGITQYTQDWDETLPPMHTPAEMQDAIFPYVRNRRIFRSPVTGLAFTPNAALSGKPLSNFPNPSSTEIFRDPRHHRDGKSVMAYLDGHVVEQ